MPIYYKRLEPFNPLVASGNSRELIACCQKGRSCKSSPSPLIVRLLFNGSRLCEAAFYSTLLSGFKEVFKELNSWGRSQREFTGECISGGPVCSSSRWGCRVNCGCKQESLWTAGGSHGSCAGHLPRSSPSGVNGLGGHLCSPLSRVRDLPRRGGALGQVRVVGLPAPRMPGASPSCCLPRLNPVREPTELHLKPVGRSGLLQRLLLSLPALVVRDSLLTSRANLPEGSS